LFLKENHFVPEKPEQSGDASRLAGRIPHSPCGSDDILLHAKNALRKKEPYFAVFPETSTMIKPVESNQLTCTR
jgi:hypothetical protein